MEKVANFAGNYQQDFMKYLIRLTLVLCVAAVFAALSGCNKAHKWQKMEGFVWNTSYHITFRGDGSLKDSVIATLNRVGQSLNVFDSTSLISKVNRLDSAAVNPDFRNVYQASLDINRITDGAFDPTLSPLITAWGFGPGHTPTADTLRIDSLMRFIGIDRTHLNNNMIVKENRAISFNFSGIAKGYGCDAVAEVLLNNGVTDMIVEIGGEIRAIGLNPNNEPWRVSIDRPILSSDREIHDSQEIIQFSDKGLATSGNYRNFHKSGDHTFGHTISAKTGRPVQTDIISASVIAENTMLADGLATAFMTMGSVKARQLADSLHTPAMFVLSDSTVWTSPEFKKLIVK